MKNSLFRFCILMFLQFFTWGAWFATLGLCLGSNEFGDFDGYSGDTPRDTKKKRKRQNIVYAMILEIFMGIQGALQEIQRKKKSKFFTKSKYYI